jgi:hypothetical protein
MAKIIYKRSDFATSNYARSGFVKKLKQSGGANNLSNRDLRKVFTEMKEASAGGPLTDKKAKEVLGELKYDHGDHFSERKARIVGRGMFKSGKWYRRPATEVAQKTIPSGPNKIEKPEAKTTEKPVVPASLEKKAEIKNEGAKQALQSPRRASSGNIAIPILYKKLSRSKDYLRNQITRSNQALSRGMSNLENLPENEDANKNINNNTDAEEKIYNLLNDIEEGNKK